MAGCYGRWDGSLHGVPGDVRGGIYTRMYRGGIYTRMYRGGIYTRVYREATYPP